MNLTWLTTIGLCVALLAIGAIIDEFFLPEKHKDWMRAQLNAFHAGLDLEREVVRDELQNAMVPLYSHDKLVPRGLFTDRYFLGGAFLIFCMTTDANTRLMRKWDEDIQPSFWWYVFLILMLLYTIFTFRWVHYKAKPGAGRLVTFLVILPTFCIAALYVTSWQFDGSASAFLLFFCAGLVTSTTIALIVAALMVIPIMITRPMNYTISQVLTAAARPDKSPFKFLAVGLSALMGLGKAVFDLFSG
jgi:hypothetical protein